MLQDQELALRLQEEEERRVRRGVREVGSIVKGPTGRDLDGSGRYSFKTPLGKAAFILTALWIYF